MPAFRRFNLYAVLAESDETLAALAGLAGLPGQIERPATHCFYGKAASSDENQDQGGTPAKVANPAKADQPHAPSWGDAEDERSAIVEHDGKIPRSWAEGFARLDPDRLPADVPLHRWQRFVDDVGVFLDSGFAVQAAALGWGPYDLFGCDRDRPFARIDQAGLLWLLDGARLVSLSEDTAGIETRTGARQIYRRRPSEPGRVLAWELGS